MPQDVVYRTLLFERRLAAPLARVLEALADPVQRARWSAPSETAAFVYDEADFREGGKDVFRCGSKDDPQFTGVTSYLSIDPGRRITSSEIVSSGGQALTASLITTVLATEGAATRLHMVVQVTSFCGKDMLKNTQTGNNAALDNLVRHLGG
ncbi:MAG TPA: SRPBCC domain-containing protein [Devosia sp.]|jgi:uncharacterized protein YndB with AHSA1/START domain|uniref:SRPBCC domain-containing protein n=1 Tax=Devosia sp. TaxID=1871048 RepID=UPI002F93276D